MPAQTWDLRIARERTDNVLLLSLSGRVCQASAPRLRDALTAAGAEPRVVVDLGALDYISGPGLAALQEAAAAAAAGGRTFVVCGPEGSVRIAFELAGLLSALAVEPNRARGFARVLSIIRESRSD